MTNEELDTELINECSGSDLEKVKELIELGADVHARGDLALQCACVEGNFEIVKYLVEKGADINAKELIAIRLAFSCGKEEIGFFLQDVIRKRKLGNLLK